MPPPRSRRSSRRSATAWRGALWIWSEADTRRYFLAGGGAEGDFAAHFARALASRERIVRGLDDATYHGIAGGAFYLVSGRKSRGRV